MLAAYPLNHVRQVGVICQSTIPMNAKTQGFLAKGCPGNHTVPVNLTFFAECIDFPVDN